MADKDGDEFPLGVVPGPASPRRPIASPHCIPLFSRPIVALSTFFSRRRCRTGSPRPRRTSLPPSSMNRTEQSRARGRAQEARRGEATQARRGEDEERTPESTDSTDDNEGENKNKAVRQLNDRTRTHAAPSPDRTESWPTSFLDVLGNRSVAVNGEGDIGFFVRRPKKGSGYFMLYPPSASVRHSVFLLLLQSSSCKLQWLRSQLN